MSRNARRLGGLAVTVAAAVSAATLAVPLTAAQAAAVETEATFTIADTDGDFSYGVYRTPAGSSTPVAVVAESATLDVGELDVSRDGSRFVVVEHSFNAAGGSLRDKVVVRDAGGRTVRVVDDLPGSGDSFAAEPVLSPDGSTVVWTKVTLSATEFSINVIKVAVASGTQTVLAGDAGHGPFLDATTVLLSDGAGAASTIQVSGGARTPITGSIPDNAFDLGVSPDGTKMVWSNDTSGSSSVSTSTIETAPLSVSSGTATIGAATALASGLNNASPAFTRNSATVQFIKDDGDGGEGDLWSVPAAGGTPTALPATPTVDEIEVGIGATNTLVPAAATSAVATLAGTRAIIRFGLPADPDVSGLLLTRKLNGATQKTVYVPAPLTGFLDTGLVVGTTYLYEYRTVDRSGNQQTDPAATRQLTAVVPQPSFRDPTSITATRAPFLVRFAGNTPSNVLYTVDVKAGASAFSRWVTAAPTAYRTFGAPASAGVAATTAVVGQTYTFKVSATDGFGNSTATVTGTRGVVPFDQSRATLVGGVGYGATNTWLGSVYRLGTTSAYARFSQTGDRFSIIGERCPTCGVMDVYDGTTRVATIDTRASTRAVRQVLYTRSYTAIGSHTLTVKSRATAGRPYVIVDGFGVRR